MEPSLVPAVVIAVLVVGLGVVVLVMLAMDKGDPAETALAYEQAWDRLDFDTVWRLSAPELRDGRPQAEFVRAKRAAYARQGDLAGLVERAGVDQLDVVGQRARAVTHLTLRDGTEMLNEVRLRHEEGRWLVEGYGLTPAPAPPATPATR